ncbi:ROK family protein [Streptomyces sp. H27-D2]|uniref:ROK family protein n=1 Tax=Streptomyces sp. H27-D2 TaxID=3046304 RepID=UPI002DB70C93|nr:ROK family protein [Streptomyces sp. H27-D2]MEC4019441.1 ROK family protein [Streptomyces sp. H27-D2]
MTSPLYGSVEAGGTKFVCLVGTGPRHIVARTRIPTQRPDTTLEQVVAFFREARSAHGPLAAVGIASFGPLELRPSHTRYGHITTTPKAGWADVDIAGAVGGRLGVPVGLHTDVNGAALGEARWGAARGLDNFVYVTVGTGVGGAAVIAGEPVRGLVHTEMGHVSVPRQPGDDYPGQCPYHGDCLEGMAGGAALTARWGRRAELLAGADLRTALAWEAGYLAEGLRGFVLTTAPERVLIGGGVSALPGLFPLLRDRFTKVMAGYPGLPEQAEDGFIVPAGLGPMAGPAGGLVLAARAASADRASSADRSANTDRASSAARAARSAGTEG